MSCLGGKVPFLTLLDTNRWRSLTLIEALATEARCNINPAKHLQRPWLRIRTRACTVARLSSAGFSLCLPDFGIVTLSCCCYERLRVKKEPVPRIL